MRTLLVTAFLLPSFVGCWPQASNNASTKKAATVHAAKSPDEVAGLDKIDTTAAAEMPITNQTQPVVANHPIVSPNAVIGAAAAGETAGSTANANSRASMKAPAATVAAGETETLSSWTRQRIVLLGQGGPRLVDVQVNVDGVELLAGLQGATKKTAEELKLDFSKPPSWESLLEKPLIRSGWLGNLVPTDEQRQQLFSLYDTNKDQLVAIEEFQAFLTRGLSRAAQLRVVRGRSTAALLDTPSAWGPIDRNADSELTAEERSLVLPTMLQYDFDGDRIITAAELRSVNDTSNGRMAASSSGRMMDVTAVLSLDPAKPALMTQALFEHYTFTETIPLSSFFSWPQSRMRQLNTDGDGELTKLEMRELSGGAPDCVISATFPNSITGTSASVNATVAQIIDASTWVSSPTGGRLNFPGCIMTVQWKDAHDPTLRTYVERQLAASLDNPQLSSLLVSQLDLKEGALELLRERGEKAGESAWAWLVAPRHWHITVSWTLPDAPWFELMDANGDQRLVVAELERFDHTCAAWDRNQDGSIQLEEMPIAVLLSISRDDSRQALLSMGGPAAEKRGANTLPTPAWFTGMDYNSDGELSKSEFLGEEKEFESLDKDGDGIIGAREVYVPH